MGTMLTTRVDSAMEQVLIAGTWRKASQPTGCFRAVNPATGEAIGPNFPCSSEIDIELALTAATEAAEALAMVPATAIADFLDAYANAITAAKDALVSVAHAETGLPATPRLADVELPRTSAQLRQAAHAARHHTWTQPIIDTQAGLRAHFSPLHKPALLFGPNNFPFAFNAVAGSDFASAIAAHCPVIAKAHPSHPTTSKLLATLAQDAAIACGLPAATVQLFYNVAPELGLRLAGDRRIGAIGFTGSRNGGMALKAAADTAGIPFYAEMSSVNPVVLFPGALRERGAALAQEFFSSCTMGSGQFCTNPGVVLVPEDTGGDAFIATATGLFAATAPMVLLSRNVQQHLDAAVQQLTAHGARIIAGDASQHGPGTRYTPTLLEVQATTFLAQAQALQQEAFGPVSLLVRYRNLEEALAVTHAFDGNLTGSLHIASDGSDDHAAHRIAAALRPRVGRLVENKWPTGVAVSAAMQHGGPYPSTSHAGFTSVGMPGAIRRFAQLQSYDNVRDDRLPIDLRNANPLNMQRLVDGVWSDRAL